MNGKDLLTAGEQAALGPYNPIRIPAEIPLMAYDRRMKRLWARNVDPDTAHRMAHHDLLYTRKLGREPRQWWLAWEDTLDIREIGDTEDPDGPSIFVDVVMNLSACDFTPDAFISLWATDEEALELAQAMVLDGVELIQVKLADRELYFAAEDVGYSLVWGVRK